MPKDIFELTEKAVITAIKGTKNELVKSGQSMTCNIDFDAEKAAEIVKCKPKEKSSWRKNDKKY